MLSPAGSIVNRKDRKAFCAVAACHENFAAVPCCLRDKEAEYGIARVIPYLHAWEVSHSCWAFPIQFYTWFLHLSSIQIKPDLTQATRTHSTVWKATVILWHHHPSAPYLNIPESVWLQLLTHDARQGEGLNAVLEVLGCWCHLRRPGVSFFLQSGCCPPPCNDLGCFGHILRMTLQCKL